MATIKYYRECLDPNLSSKSNEYEIKQAFDQRMNNLGAVSKEVIEKAFKVLDFEAKCKRLATSHNTMQMKPQRDLFVLSMPTNKNKNDCKIAKNSYKPFMCSCFIKLIFAPYIPNDCMLEFCLGIRGDDCCPQFNLEEFEMIPNAVFSMNKPGTNLQYIIGAASQYDCTFNVDINMILNDKQIALQRQYYMKIYTASSCVKAVGCTQRTDIISFAPRFKTKINDAIIMIMKVKKGLNIGHGFCNMIPDPKTKATTKKNDKFHSMIWIHESNVNEIEISFYKKKNSNVLINEITARLKTKRLNNGFDGILIHIGGRGSGRNQQIKQKTAANQSTDVQRMNTDSEALDDSNNNITNSSQFEQQSAPDTSADHSNNNGDINNNNNEFSGTMPQIPQMQQRQQQHSAMVQSSQYEMYQQQFMQMLMTNPQQQAILMNMNPTQRQQYTQNQMMIYMSRIAAMPQQNMMSMQQFRGHNDNQIQRQYNNTQQMQCTEYKCNQYDGANKHTNNARNSHDIQQQQTEQTQLMKWCINNGFESYHDILFTQCQLESPEDFKDLTDDNLKDIAEKHLGLKYAKKNRFIQAIKNYVNYAQCDSITPQHHDADSNSFSQLLPPIQDGNNNDGSCNTYDAYHNGYHSESQRYNPCNVYRSKRKLFYDL